MASEETDHQRSFPQKIARGYLYMLLIEQREARSAISHFQGAI